MTELFVDFRKFENGAVEHEWKAGVAEAAEQFLAFAERIAEQNGGFVVVERFLAKANDSCNDLLGGRKAIP